MNNPKVIMARWEVTALEPVAEWLSSLPKDEFLQISAVISQLEISGPDLGSPQVKLIKNTKIKKLKELRVKTAKKLFRILFAFDKKRKAVLLVGGDKIEVGYDAFYDINIPIAEERFEEHERNQALEAAPQLKSKKSSESKRKTGKGNKR